MKGNEREDSLNLQEEICMLDQSIISLISHTCGEIEEIRKVWDTNSTWITQSGDVSEECHSKLVTG